MNFTHALKWSFLSELAFKAIQPIVFVVLARFLTPEDYDLWLHEGAHPEIRQRLLSPCPPELLEAFPVSLRVNNPRNDSPECIQPAPED